MQATTVRPSGERHLAPTAAIRLIGAAVLVGSALLGGCSSPTPKAVAPAVGTPGQSVPSGATGAVVPGAAQPAVPAAVGSPALASGTAITTPSVTATRPPATKIVGHVVGPDGKPLVDVAVAMVSGSAPVAPMAIFTDATGKYEWPTEPGTFQLQAYRDGYVTGEKEVKVGAGETVTADFTLQKQ
jgi:hypothetical protein